MKWHMCVLIRILKWKTNSLYTGEGASQIFIIQTVLSLQNVRSNNNFEMKNEYQLVSIYRGRGFSNFHYTDILIFTKGIPTPGKTVWILKMGPIRLIVCWKARRNTNVYIYMLTNSHSYYSHIHTPNKKILIPNRNKISAVRRVYKRTLFNFSRLLLVRHP